MAVTKEKILELLRTNDAAVARAVVVLTQLQTASEQATEATLEGNGVGWSSAHARMGTSMAKQVARRGWLSEKQLAYWRRETASGRMRIGIYWRQLLDAAERKAEERLLRIEREA